MRFLSTPGVNNAKVWALDDFSMKVQGVPEPSSIALAGTALVSVIVLGFCRQLTTPQGRQTP